MPEKTQEQFRQEAWTAVQLVNMYSMDLMAKTIHQML